MAGYSGTPLVRKLGIKEQQRLLWIRAPDDFESMLGPLPEGVRVTRDGRGERYEMIHLFARNRAELDKRLPSAIEKLSYEGSLWISWPKKTSGLFTDLTGDGVREAGLGAGLVDVKVCAVDDVWSGLKFMFRLKDQPKKLK